MFDRITFDPRIMGGARVHPWDAHPRVGDRRAGRPRRRHGHDAVHLRDDGLHRALDEQVFAKALAEDRIVLTFDLDFGDLAALTRERTARVILFRLENTRAAHVIERLGAVLAASSEALSRGAILIVEEARHRIRFLPIGEPER